MMCNFGVEPNRAKIAAATRCVESELGVRPRSFRAGRWGFGPSVSMALAAEGYLVDASVSPFIDWTTDGGPDYSAAPNRPYRFRPERPLEPVPDGPMVAIATTVEFLRGNHRTLASVRLALSRSGLGKLGVIGALNCAGLLSRRWLSPETSRLDDMLRLAEACLRSGEPASRYLG